MIRIQVAHTADLGKDARDAARALLYDVFDDMAEDDWEHCLGGVHVLVWDADTLVGHAALVQRRLLSAGRALRTGYVEGVGVLPGRRRQGHGGTMMAVLERFIREAYDLGALGATEDGARFYAGRGWRLWRGPSYALTPEGIRRTEDDDGAIYVLPGDVPLDLSGAIVCDWRDGDVW